MFKGIRLKRTAVPVLFLFAWFCFAGQFQPARAQDKPADLLKQGKESYRTGDYEKSIGLLEAYIADPQNPREKRAEAYYFLAKNYHAAAPDKVKETLLKAFETDWFFSAEEKDVYFKKVSDDLKREFIEKIPVDRYLKQAESAFEKGKYDEARYFYRVIARKLPAKTFDRQIETCADAKTKKRRALALYRENQLEKAYIPLKALLRLSPGDEKVKAAVNRVDSQKIIPMTEAGDKYFNKKNYREALPFYEYVLAFTPDDPDIKEKIAFCREMVEQEKSRGKTIEKEGPKKKKKKKFPLLPVILGAAAAAVILYFIFKKKKEPAPTTGSLNVQSSPAEARIWLDGGDTARTTPGILTDIQAGSHTVRLTKDGYLDYQVNVTVEAGRETLLFATLTEAPTPNFVTSADTVSVPEGGQGTFRVKLSESPAADVTASVTRVSGDTDITVSSGGSLTFTTANWDTFQTVTLSAAGDSDAENGEAIFRISASGIPDKDVLAVEQDLGGPGYLLITPASDFTSSGTGGGPFSPTNKTYILQNTGTGDLDWTASQTTGWVTLSDTGGSLDAGTSTAVTVSINNNANTLPVGIHNETVTFLNTTNGGGSTTRNVVLEITAADAPPSVTIQNPADGGTVSGTVTVQVDASDDNGVDRVEIYIDDVLAATLTAAPYTYQWDTGNVSNGTHTVKATAYDTANRTAEDQVSVNVANSG